MISARWLIVASCLTAIPLAGCVSLRSPSEPAHVVATNPEMCALLRRASLGPALLVVSVVQSGPSRRGVLVVNGKGKGRLVLEEVPGAVLLDLVVAPDPAADQQGWLAAVVVALSPLAMGRDRIYEPPAQGQLARLKMLNGGRLVMVLRIAEADGLPCQTTWCDVNGRPRWQVSLRGPWSDSEAGRAPDALEVRRVTAGLEDLPEPVRARLMIHEVRMPPAPWDPHWLEPGAPLPEG